MPDETPTGQEPTPDTDASDQESAAQDPQRDAQAADRTEPTAQAGQGDDGQDSQSPSNDQISEVRREAAKYRTRLREAEARLEDYDSIKARLEELENERLSEDEKRQKEFEATQEERDRLKADLERSRVERQELLTDTALLSAVSQPDLNIASPNAALKLIDRSLLEYDDDGRPDPKTVNKAVKELLEAEPWIVREPRVSAGSTTNPERDKAADNGKESLEQRRSRIFGSGIDIFDPEVVRGTGGGVHYAGQDANPSKP